MFPDWGFSYNALYVPLGYDGWQCALMLPSDIEGTMQRRSWNEFEGKLRPVRNYGYAAQSQPYRKPEEYQSSSWGYSLFDEDDGSKLWMKNRIKLDRDDFIRWFDVGIDERTSYMSADFNHYRRFLRDRLRLSTWDLPVDGAGIARILKDAVRDGRLIPVLNRSWSGSGKVQRHFAPQSWPASSTGDTARRSTGTYEGVLSWSKIGKNGLGRVSGGGDVFDLSSKAIGLDAAAAASDSLGATVGNIRTAGTDWFGMALDAAETVAGGMLGGSSDEYGNSLLEGFSDGDTPLSGDPFEYVPSDLMDQVQEVAGMFVTPAEQEECMQAWVEDQDMCHSIGKAMGGYATVDACIQRARHNYNICMGFTRPL